MIPLTVAEVAAAVGAQPAGPVAADALVRAVVADSRTAGPGALFVALPGARVDGHRFVLEALGRGAVAALTAGPVAGAGCLVVPDPLAALGRLARTVVDRAARGGLRVIGLTGSQGKTSTKDLLAQILERSGPTVAPPGNLNNELGLPLTVCQVGSETRYLVAEMGARGPGHIAYLCQICPPDVGLVLNVGHAHLGEFGGRAGIARAKSELPRAVAAGGTVVLNAADPLVWEMRGATTARIVAFAVGREPDTPDAVWATGPAGDGLGRWRFLLHEKADGLPRPPVEIELKLSGRHQVDNAVAAAGAARAVGVGLGTVAEALSAAELRSRWRMELQQRDDGVLVINDAYNASPDAVRAAIGTVAEMAAARPTRPDTWAVLGDMLELGPTAAAEHAAIGRFAGQHLTRLVAVGEWAEELAAGAREAGLDAGRAVAAGSKQAAVDLVRSALRPGDIVLVKASRGLALDTVAEALSAGEQGAGPVPDSEDGA